MKLQKTGLKKVWSKNDQYFHKSLSKVIFINLAVRPSLEFNKIRKHKHKNQVKFKMCRAKVLADN